MKSKQNIYKLFSAIFLLLIVLPNVVMMLGLEKHLPNNENRKLMTFDEIDFTHPVQAVKGFKQFYNDNFGLRKLSFAKYSSFKSNVLKEDPLPRKAFAGENGWYFLGDDYENVFSNSIGLHSAEKKEEKLASKKLQYLKEALDKRGIPFYFVLATNKHEVYGEHLPFNFEERLPKFDRMIDTLKERFPFVIDLKTTMMNSKGNGLLYHKTDSHWNDLGAFYGYQYMMREMGLTAPKLDQYSIVTEKVDQQDLTMMINQKVDEDITVLRPKFETNGSRTYSKGPVDRFKNPKKKLKVLVFRDSYSLAMIPFFKEDFAECLFVNTQTPDLALIDKEQPDIVILQMVNRRLETFSSQPFKK